MNPIALFGAGFLWLAAKRPKPSPINQARVQLIAASQSIAAIQDPEGKPYVSTRKQVKMLWRCIRGMWLTPTARVGAMAVFDLGKNFPTPWQLAVLYSIDPGFEIVEEGVASIKVKDMLLIGSLLEDPALDRVARGADPMTIKMVRNERAVIDNAILLLPEDRLVLFAADLLREAMPVAEEFGFGESSSTKRYPAMLQQVDRILSGDTSMAQRLYGSAHEMGRVAEEYQYAKGGRLFQDFLKATTDAFGILTHTIPSTYRTIKTPTVARQCLAAAMAVRAEIEGPLSYHRQLQAMSMTERGDYLRKGSIAREKQPWYEEWNAKTKAIEAKSSEAEQTEFKRLYQSFLKRLR